MFSTYVEVIPRQYSREQIAKGVLHVCGGDPRDEQANLTNRLVFSTYVEVILDESNTD